MASTFHFTVQALPVQVDPVRILELLVLRPLHCDSPPCAPNAVCEGRHNARTGTRQLMKGGAINSYSTLILPTYVCYVRFPLLICSHLVGGLVVVLHPLHSESLEAGLLPGGPGRGRATVVDQAMVVAAGRHNDVKVGGGILPLAMEAGRKWLSIKLFCRRRWSESRPDSETRSRRILPRGKARAAELRRLLSLRRDL